MYLRSALGFVAASVLSASLATTSYAQPSKRCRRRKGPRSRCRATAPRRPRASRCRATAPRRPRASRRRATAPRRPRASRRRATAPRRPRQVEPSYGAPQAPSKSTPGYGAPQAPGKSGRRATAPRRPRPSRPRRPERSCRRSIAGSPLPGRSRGRGFSSFSHHRHRRRAPASRFHRGSSRSHPFPLSRVSRLHLLSRRRRIESSMPPPASGPIEVPALSKRRMPLASRSHFR